MRVRCDTCKQTVAVTFPLALCPKGTMPGQSHTIPISAVVGAPLARVIGRVLGRKRKEAQP